MIVFQKLTWYFLLTIPIVAGISTLEIDTAGGFTFTGLVWVAQLSVGAALLCLAYMQTGYRGSIREWWPWLALGFWIWLSILWCGGLGRRNVQEAMQLSMPLVVGLLAASTITTREQLQSLLRMFAITFVLLAAFVVIYVSGTLEKEWVETRLRPAALSTALVGCLFLAGLSQRFWLALVGWGICVLFTTLTESRMATLALLGALILYPAYRTKFWNFAGLAAVALVAVVLFYTPIFQERFFEGHGGTVSDVAEGKFESAGRFEAWPLIFEEALEHPIVGAGVGSAFDFVPKVWPITNHVHNDYLRMLFELGMFGLVLFVWAGVWQLAVLYRRIGSTRGVVQTTYIACWLGFCVLFLSCATDNTILYNIYFTNPLFMILGAANGVAWAERRDAAMAGSTETSKLLNARRFSRRVAYRPVGVNGTR